MHLFAAPSNAAGPSETGTEHTEPHASVQFMVSSLQGNVPGC